MDIRSPDQLLVQSLPYINQILSENKLEEHRNDSQDRRVKVPYVDEVRRVQISLDQVVNERGIADENLFRQVSDSYIMNWNDYLYDEYTSDEENNERN